MKLSLLFLVSLFAVQMTFGQSFSPQTKLLENMPDGSPRGQGILPSYQEDPIGNNLEGLEKSYRFSQPTTSSYDSLLLNTEDFAANEVPRYSPQVLANRLYGMPTLIPMDYNNHVQRYIDVYTVRKRDLTAKVLGLSRVYFPIFEEYLDRAGLPIELKYLSVVESALDPHARSRVGATGLWQFMLGTGRMYGLQVNSFVDERKDPYKATEAATKYLKNAYEEFGDWLLAIASYNCGPGNVRKAINRSGGKRNFWEIMPYLPRETRGYVPAFVAVTYVFNYAAKHNIYPVRVNFRMSQDTLHLKRMDITFSEIEKMTGAPVADLRYLNPELKLDRIPYSSQDYVLRVPRSVAAYFAKYEHTLRSQYGKRRNSAPPRVSSTRPSSTPTRVSYSPPAGTKTYYYTVQSGDVVGNIAERYGVRASDISRWNNLYRYRIKVGQKLKIYTTPAKASRASSYRPQAATSPAPTPQVSGGSYHTVRQGDTLWDISRRYGVSVERLKSLNPRLVAGDLKIGQSVRIK